MLTVLETRADLVLTRPGRLVPWLGRALRGLAAGRLKDRVCREPARRYCRGCPHMAGCAYGETVEADAPAGTATFAGQDDATRPLVIAPAFPAPAWSRPGLVVPLRVLFAGPAAAAHARAFWEALAAAGADPMAGLGPDHVTFRFDAVRGGPQHIELPRSPGRELLPCLRVTLTAPLVIRAHGVLVRRPTCLDLARACLRTLGGLSRLYGAPPPAQTFAALKAAAARVAPGRTRWLPFRQSVWSNRQRAGGVLHGVVGRAEFFDVPRGLAEWLAWGGRLHVGTYRVAGAGGWRVEER